MNRLVPINSNDADRGLPDADRTLNGCSGGICVSTLGPSGADRIVLRPANFRRSTSSPRSSTINPTDTLQPMHCPYCSAQLVEATRGELRCSLSGSLFSISVREQFETLTLKAPPLSDKLTRFNLGRWFCPCCGMATNNGVCAKCGPVITSRLARQLLELNPHERN